MKALLCIVILIICFNNFAAQGVVTSFRAALLSSPNENNAKVYQVYKKGEVFFVSEESIKEENESEFYETIDRSGRTAYIKKEYVKIIYNDERENSQNISYFHPKYGHDTTDFRLEEPIPSTYPFESREFSRLNVSLSLGSNPKDPYNYQVNTKSKDFSFDTGLKIIFQKKIEYDKVDRVYFGLYSSISSVTNEITFSTEEVARENRSTLKLGPILSFDFYKTHKHLLNLGTGFTWNYHRSVIKIQDNTDGSEERIFNGFSISPFVLSSFAFREIIPGTDFTIGSELNFQLPHSQTTSNEKALNRFWSEEDKLNQDLRLQALFFLGFNTKY